MPTREPPDPLDAALQPPPGETAEQRVQRLAQEAEARRISNEIDEDIKRERALRKKRQIVKLLLLGQSESGESPSMPLLLVCYRIARGTVAVALAPHRRRS